jgi:YD repeat-containing protein
MSSGATYGYELNGSRVSNTRNGQAATTYAWNASSLLGAITTATGSAGHLYSGDGERIDGAQRQRPPA